METVTIDILNNKAVKLLQDLEHQQLIRMHRDKAQSNAFIDWAIKYKGAMTKQSLKDINNQLNDLRNQWE